MNTIPVSAQIYKDYCDLYFYHQSRGMPEADHSSEFRLKASYAINSNPDELINLGVLDPSLLLQVKSDLKRLNGDFERDQDFLDKVVSDFSFPENATLVDKYAAFHYKAEQSVGKIHPDYLNALETLRESYASQIMIDGGSVIELGEKFPHLGSRFLYDMKHFNSDIPLNDSLRLARQYVDYENLALKQRKLGHMPMVRTLEERRQQIASKISVDPVALLNVGLFASQKNIQIHGKYRSDRDQVIGLSHWDSESVQTYDRFVKNLFENSSDSMRDPVDRFFMLANRVHQNELSRVGLREVSMLKEVLKETSSEIFSDHEKLARFMEEYPEYRHDLKESYSKYQKDKKQFDLSEGKIDQDVFSQKAIENMSKTSEKTGHSTAFDSLESAFTNPEFLSSLPNDGGINKIVREGESDDSLAPISSLKPSLTQDSLPSVSQASSGFPQSTEPKKFSRIDEHGNYSARIRSAEEGSINDEVMRCLGSSQQRFMDLLKNKETPFLALPLTQFSSGGLVARELQRLAKKDKDFLLKLYQNTISAKLSLMKEKGGLNIESNKLSFDRLEMGRRAMALALAKTGVKDLDELDADATKLISSDASALDPKYRLDPGGYIQSDNAEGRETFAQKFMNDLKKSVGTGRKVMGRASGGINSAIDIMRF